MKSVQNEVIDKLWIETQTRTPIFIQTQMRILTPIEIQTEAPILQIRWPINDQILEEFQ
jgi:hypothetical protein